ncbi:hypothetical protein [Verminephrobacter eiseniae]|uniref:hypothetical protein n=1 Tax=Verminephrobacter eiseniae TaxID=364317 RepID=UPI0022380326|nr:hypothetical protein [Verminephrobacter eiseniae]
MSVPAWGDHARDKRHGMEYARTLATADHHARGRPGSKAMVAGIRHGLRQTQACAPKLPISRRRLARMRRIVEQLLAHPIPAILDLGGGITEENRFEKKGLSCQR